MKKKIVLAFLAIASFYSCKEEHSDLPDGLYAKIETNKGDIIVQLNFEKAPITVANYVALAEGKNDYVTNENLKKRPFFDGLKFHRVINDFMIQTGDPLGTGSGDTGYKFKDEFTDLQFDKGGVLAMANNGPATNSSQFFITHLATPWLDGKHTIFGHVVEKGMEVVNKIQQNDYINTVTIIRNGEAAKKFNAVKIFNDYFAVENKNQKEKAAVDTENKRVYNEKYKEVRKQKVAYFAELKAKATKTKTGLQYVITKKSGGKKPAIGTGIFIHYAGFLENAELFDASIESIAQTFGKYDENRAAQNGYQPIPFQAGKKDGMIPGFIEGIEKLSFGDKAVIFIPSQLGYGAAGAGGVIPPNANIIFEIELLEKMPQ
ncbi:peptidylprolyl isomerase [Flavobacterium sp. GSP27]|uniref:peptidylprolyl isomerase n=1 Tax=unclassified Flavobacterium TaxID=196869 RepID=UPI000F8393D8|nr:MULTISPECIES: peptidylprolyl isomerase [unclassified Flavobacterium]RTY72938.1 peptidylprolyl isomerase [Flavobacterium sp. LS1R10]RTY83385.1 peptidylprolyl isomerase [Flavobacterium sp. ZB4P23]RTY93309.1 peptidylprolyl isomerase [Flavobacterium sp. RSP46]RTZ05265.1 peptidylprolyl isomerase [Flavobacterium sp. GSP27]